MSVRGFYRRGKGWVPRLPFFAGFEFLHCGVAVFVSCESGICRYPV
jgi:hypothetical protein